MIRPLPTIDSESDRSDDLAGRLFALTLTDNGPNATESTNKLWNSRADFQKRGPSSGIIAASPTPVSVDQVAASLSRLHMGILRLQSNPSDTQSPNTYPSDSHCPKPEIPPRGRSASTVSGRQLSEKDGNHRSVKALKLLSNIEVRTRMCFHLFLAATEGSYDTIKHELASLRRATQDIRRNTDYVKSRKAEVLSGLDELECQLLQLPNPTNPKGPVEFNSGK